MVVTQHHVCVPLRSMCLHRHCGNAFDLSDKAYKSVQEVRDMHSGVRQGMDKAHFRQSDKWITMYDMVRVTA